MHLIDCHRLCVCIFRLPLLHPCGIFPLIGNIHDTGCICRTDLAAERIWITLHEYLSGLRLDLILVYLANELTRDKQLINTGIIQLPHRMPSAIPVIEITNHRYSVCIRCPYSKQYTFHTIHGHWMCTHLLIDAIMFSLIEQTDINRINYRFEHVRIKICHFVTIVKPDVQFIFKWFLIFYNHREKTRHTLRYKRVLLLRGYLNGIHNLCPRQICIDIQIIDTLMHTKNMMRVVMNTLDQSIDFHPVYSKNCFSFGHVKCVSSLQFMNEDSTS